MNLPLGPILTPSTVWEAPEDNLIPAVRRPPRTVDNKDNIESKMHVSNNEQLHIVYIRIYSPIPGPKTLLLVPVTSITLSSRLELEHSTICPLRSNTVPRPSTFRAYPKASQSQPTTSSLRMNSSPVSIVDPHSPGFGWIDRRKS